MNKNTIGLAAAGTVGGLAAGWTVWSWLANRNVPTPAYRVVARQDGYELREYDSLVVAETEVEGSYRDALMEGFDRLFRYISGDNAGRAQIRMTAPVLESERTGPGTIAAAPAADRPAPRPSRRVAFVMPPDAALELLPAPRDPRVRLRPVPARKVAATRFAGLTFPNRVARKKRELASAVARHGYVATSAPESAIYNAPWTIPFLRRNEVLVDVS